ncbi:hypothetical protein XabCFBP2524_09290 [Xanthomonas axonopodis pv. begoniae]|nr:hypothetical protein XabCFBP2524_09290 [Xanthomonas axonopodis pv. begoniae]
MPLLRSAWQRQGRIIWVGRRTVHVFDAQHRRRGDIMRAAFATRREQACNEALPAQAVADGPPWRSCALATRSAGVLRVERSASIRAWCARMRRARLLITRLSLSSHAAMRST